MPHATSSCESLAMKLGPIVYTDYAIYAHCDFFAQCILRYWLHQLCRTVWRKPCLLFPMEGVWSLRSPLSSAESACKAFASILQYLRVLQVNAGNWQSSCTVQVFCNTTLNHWTHSSHFRNCVPNDLVARSDVTDSSTVHFVSSCHTYSTDVLQLLTEQRFETDFILTSALQHEIEPGLVV